MKHRRLLLSALPILAVAGTWPACGGGPRRPHAYVGAAFCARCHGGEAGGFIHEDWQGTAHARAWLNLAGAMADSIAREMGVAGDPRQAGACLECHSTSHGAPAALRGTLTLAEGVSCEACHSAGAGYAKKLVMPEPREAHRAGLREDPEGACVTCHRAGVAHVKPFDHEDHWRRVAHRLPRRDKP